MAMAVCSRCCLAAASDQSLLSGAVSKLNFATAPLMCIRVDEMHGADGEDEEVYSLK